MRPAKLLLCTDMDRTVIPNGDQPEHPLARSCFNDFCQRPEIQLVYVTGRHRELVQQAIQRYDLPAADFVITDVGTRIYQVAAGEWRELRLWQETIAAAWHGVSHEQLLQALSPRSELVLQESSKQSRYKLSYYLPLDADKDRLLAWVETRLRQLGVEASLVWSIDEAENVGLLDVLPRNATKLHGIEFLQQQLGYRHDQVIFAGDSGNDLPVLVSPIRSVLVANAGAELKIQAQQLARQNGQADALYLAEDNAFPLGGHYAAGVLQGVWHFAPEFRQHLQQIAPRL